MQTQEEKRTLEDNTTISKYTLESILMHFSTIIKRLVTVIIVEAILTLFITAGFIWYLSLPEEEYSSITQTADDIKDSSIEQKVGD